MSHLAAICLLCLCVACLPLGEGPEGRHLIHDRTLGQAAFFRPAADPATSHLFVTGAPRFIPLSSPGGLYQVSASDLYQVDFRDLAAPTTGLGQRQPAVVGVPDTTIWDGVWGLAQDSRGRLILTTLEGSPWQTLARFDPRSGVVEALANLEGFVMLNPVVSPGRTRMFIDAQTDGILLDLDGQRKLVNVGYPSFFLGEDFYYRERQMATSVGKSRLIRIRPESEPEVLAVWQKDLVEITPLLGDLPPTLLVKVSGRSMLLDPVTLQSAELPSELYQAQFVSASPNGRWLLFHMPVEDTVGPWAAYDRTTGDLRRLEWQMFEGADSASPTWRPGREEVWFQASGQFLTWSLSDGRASWYQGYLAPCHPTGGAGWDSAGLFNRDGSLWFSAGTEGRELGSPMHVGWADDPGRPTFPIDPEGMWVKACDELEDYRLLVSAWADTDSQTDLYLVDVKTGSMRALAGAAKLVAVGKTRALALVDWESWRSAGTLALIDLATGARTSFAESAKLAAVDVPAGADVLGATDPLAPGTGVAFISRYRLDSPYDGLWVTNLP